MADAEELVSCYNRGCGKKFSVSNNPAEGCVHHPGQPVFHDGLKGWSCCNKRVRDFTGFLNIVGCTRSEHNPVKPPPAPLPAATPTTMAGATMAGTTSGASGSGGTSASGGQPSDTPQAGVGTSGKGEVRQAPRVLRWEKVQRPPVDEPSLLLPVTASDSLRRALEQIAQASSNCISYCIF